MARYNTAPQTLVITGATTLTYAFTGGIISLTGTAGYTVVLVNPIFFPGSRQTFYNATDGMIMLETASGQFKGNGVTLGNQIEIPTNSTYVLTSDGTDYVLTSALAGTTVFELPVTFNDELVANAAVKLNPLNANVEIKPTGTGTVDISPAGLVSIQPQGNVTIKPGGTSTLSLETSGGALSIGSSSATTTLAGSLSSTTNGATITLSPAGATGTVTISPGDNVTISAGDTLAISSSTTGSMNNVAIGGTTAAAGRFTTLTSANAVTFTANTASTSTTSGTLVVTGGIGVSGNIYAGGIQGTAIGGTTRAAGAFTTLASNGATTFTANTASTNTTSGTLVVTGGVGISGAVYAGSIQNTPIGNSSANSGAFTTLSANSSVTFTATTASTSASTGALVVSGGVGVAGRLYVTGGLQGTPVGSVTTSTGAFTSLSASSTVTLSPASANVTISPTGTGTVAISPAGSLTISPSTAGSINNMSIGASTRSTGAFTSLAANSSVSFTASTASSSTSTGALVVTGGVGIGGAVYAGSLQNTPIGSTTRSTGAFTTLTANSTVTITSTTASTTVDTGALQVDGGVGINGNIYVGGVGSFGSTVTAGFPLFLNPQSMNGTTISSTQNAVTAGPVTINNGQTVTVQGNWSIV